MTNIDFTNVMKHKTDYLSMTEINKMLEYCLEEELYRDYMLLLTLTRTGRRITEIVGEVPFTKKVGLRPCDIHPDSLIEFDILKKNHVKVKTAAGNTKTEEKLEKERFMKMPKRSLKPVDDEYLKLLNEYITYEGIAKYDRVFPITRRRADQIVKKIANACNIRRPKKKIHCHNFRHSFAINLLKKHPNDASILKQVQDLLDHSDIKVTMAYAQFTQFDKKKSLNRLFGDD